MKNLTKIKQYLLQNENELLDVIEAINSYNGSLEFLQYYYNDDDFFNTFYYNNPTEAVRASFYGNYNFCDDWVKINGYGNLDSTDEYTRIKEAKEYIDTIVNELSEVWGMLPDLSEQLTQLLISLNKED